MHVAFIGCGFAADFYATTIRNHPQLELIGVFDKNEERTHVFSRAYQVQAYRSLEELLADRRIEIVVNLTNIGDHYAVTKACLEANKHVYSEKPLASHFSEAEELLALAAEKSLYVSCAPANLLGEAAQTVWKLLRQQAIGTVWLAYAELDDGAIHQHNFRTWSSSSGMPWPYQDEFAMGCTMEHAEYYLGWLTAFFGPVREVTSFSRCLVPEKIGPDHQIPLGDDFSVCCLVFSSNVVARLTCSILAPKNHSLTLIGSEGLITVEDCWNFESPVYLQKRITNTKNFSRAPYFSEKQLVALERPPEKIAQFKYRRTTHDMDFARGIAELADALEHHRTPRLSLQHAAHITEVLSCITKTSPSRCKITTSFPPILPMSWVQEDEIGAHDALLEP